MFAHLIIKDAEAEKAVGARRVADLKDFVSQVGSREVAGAC